MRGITLQLIQLSALALLIFTTQSQAEQPSAQSEQPAAQTEQASAQSEQPAAQTEQASTQSEQPTTQAEQEQPSAQAKLPDGTMMCPNISQITKDTETLTWKTKDGWKSFDQSFSNELTTFLGAQWQGVKVGNVVCLYTSGNDSTFPVVLHYGSLTNQPTGGKWGKNLGGYQNCRSRQREDCSFTDRNIKKNTGTVYEQAQQLKSDSGGEREQGF